MLGYIVLAILSALAGAAMTSSSTTSPERTLPNPENRNSNTNRSPVGFGLGNHTTKRRERKPAPTTGFGKEFSFAIKAGVASKNRVFVAEFGTKPKATYAGESEPEIQEAEVVEVIEDNPTTPTYPVIQNQELQMEQLKKETKWQIKFDQSVHKAAFKREAQEFERIAAAVEREHQRFEEWNLKYGEETGEEMKERYLEQIANAALFRAGMTAQGGGEDDDIIIN